MHRRGQERTRAALSNRRLRAKTGSDPAETAGETYFQRRVHHRLKDASAQLLPPALYLVEVRGSVIMNSVNEPGSVVTSILPPCCFAMMSWLIERPRPVPSPAG